MGYFDSSTHSDYLAEQADGPACWYCDDTGIMRTPQPRRCPRGCWTEMDYENAAEAAQVAREEWEDR